MMKLNNVVTIDPGEHIGIIHTIEDKCYGITLEGENRNAQLWVLLNEWRPELICFEQFALRANAAKKLVGNKFITCEVIGVIKLYCQLNNICMIELLPSSKEYCGFSAEPNDIRYRSITMLKEQKITEHVRDAYRLYSYQKLFGSRFKKKIK